MTIKSLNGRRTIVAKTILSVNGRETDSSSDYKDKVTAKLKDDGSVTLRIPRNSAVGLLNICQFYADRAHNGDLGVQGKTLKLLLDKSNEV